MKNTRGYTYESTNNTIYMTRAFAKKAQNPDSKEFGEVIELMKMIPDVSFAQKTISRADNKQTYAGLDYNAMLEYLQRTRPDDGAIIDEFYHIKAEAVRESGKYAFVKKWFLVKCPEYKTASMPTNDKHIA